MDFLTSALREFPGMLAFNVGLYWIVTGIAVAVIRFAPSDFKNRRRIGERRHRPGQIRREMLTSMRSVLIFSVVAAFVMAAAERGWLRIYLDDHAYPVVYGIFATVLLIVLQDTWFYWTHRALHHRLLYRRFHKVHHKSRYPTPYTSYAFDSGEAFTNAIYIFVAALIFPYPVWALGLFMVHMLVRNVIGHSGYSIDPARSDGRPALGFLTNTVHHDLHHTANRGNFGLYFTFWDRVMGTEDPEYLDRFIEQNRRDRPVEASPTPV